uniref:Uncharacterized protein n=1 Tax=Rhizophora mucronata TaxID=61149 RepID=A0A2P2Q1F9_RHIMU
MSLMVGYKCFWLVRVYYKPSYLI